jgi:hypothetical protein
MSPMTMTFPVRSPELFTDMPPGGRMRCTLERGPQGLALMALTKQGTAGVATALLDIDGMT